MKHGFVKRRLFCTLIGILMLCGTGSTCLAKESEINADTYAICADGATEALSKDVTVTSRFGELLFGRDNRSPKKPNAKDKQQTKDTRPQTAERRLIPGGEIFGIQLKSAEVLVVDTEKSADEDGPRVGDRIIEIDGMAITRAADVARAIKESSGESNITVLRGGVKKTLRVTPDGTKGNYRLGITVRDGTAGIGTVTYIDPETGTFGGLGHGICDAETGELFPMLEGIVTEVTLGGVGRGEVGKPGELHGVLRTGNIGVLYKNCDCGVFGKLNTCPTNKEALPIATRDEVKEGPAVIYATVHGGEACAYEVTIGDIDYQSDGVKSFTVKVTDPALIAMTGGIVRGMSGSPIIQNGKLIGAVTHVMVADPTEGYGIFIENMLNAANNQSQQKAA